MPDPKPLDDVRVLDFTRLLPGAYATLLLAQYGADVVKIEDPRGGDGMRTLRVSDGRSYFDLLNRGKRSVTLDLRSPDAAPILDALLDRADVVVDSFRPSAAHRLGLDAATLRAKRPRLVCASILGFDRRSARAEAPAHDLNYQALAGLLRPPDLPGPLVSDIGGAMHAAMAILAALVQRQRTGAGSAIDVTLQSAAEAWTLFPTTRELEGACYTLYVTADGEWLALAALEAKFWRAFCEGIGRPDLVALQHAAGAAGERVRRDIGELMSTRTKDDWLAHFAGVDVCLTPLERPPAEDRNAPLAPALGADTDVVLDATGIDDAARTDLRRRGVI
jgi:alpha-methylacyl-CoA racemase